jgi:hypothetical protein
MRKSVPILLFLLGMIALLPGRGDAETRTISWTAVTTYTDGTPIETTKTVRYDIFWTQDAGLSSASLRTVASSIAQTSVTFDPDALGMPRGQTIYFTGDAVLNTGERSALASPYSWTVPLAGSLAPLRNVAVTGPVVTSPARVFRLSWDPAVSYADGTPIPAGSARYTAYWTTDPSLATGTLRTLASSIAGTSVDFDPVAAGMAYDMRVYFTASVTTGTGAQSPLSAGVPWVALNPGPATPTGGTIIRR